MLQKKFLAATLCFLFLLTVCLFVPETQAAKSNQVPIAGKAIPKFAQPLPILSVSPFIDPPAPAVPYSKTVSTVFGNQPLTINMCEFDAKVLPPGTFAVGVQPRTRVWGYIAGPCPPKARPTLRSIRMSARSL